jgi:hypothetical protein
MQLLCRAYFQWGHDFQYLAGCFNRILVHSHGWVDLSNYGHLSIHKPSDMWVVPTLKSLWLIVMDTCVHVFVQSLSAYTSKDAAAAARSYGRYPCLTTWDHCPEWAASLTLPYIVYDPPRPPCFIILSNSYVISFVLRCSHLRVCNTCRIPFLVFAGYVYLHNGECLMP